MDKQREMRLCACKAHTAKTAGQASGQVGRQVPHSPQVRSGDTGGGGGWLRLKAWLLADMTHRAPLDTVSAGEFIRRNVDLLYVAQAHSGE